MGDTEANEQQNGPGAVGGAPVVNQSFDGLSSIAPFRTDTDPDRLAALWKRWKRSFNLYLKSKVITDDARKQACLLHVAGPAVQDVYFSVVGEGDDKNYADTLKLLDDHFLPQLNAPVERHKFRQMTQRVDGLGTERTQHG